MLSPNLPGRKWDRKSWGPTTTSWYLTPPGEVFCAIATPRLVRSEKKERSVSPVAGGGRRALPRASTATLVDNAAMSFCTCLHIA